MRLRTSVVALSYVTLLTAGCDLSVREDSSQPDHPSRVEQQALRVVENVGEGRWAGAAPWDIREALTIGTVNGPAPYEFFHISDIEVDVEGNIYVLDMRLRRVRKYTSTGRFLVEMGADGGGPSEFKRDPTGLLGGMALVSDSFVVVHDPWAWKFVYFDRRGAFHHDVSLQHLPPPGNIRARLSYRLAELGRGWLLMSHKQPYGSGLLRTAIDGQYALVRVAADGSARDTLVTYYQDDDIVRSLDDRHSEFFPKPFPARWHWAVGPGGQIAFGHGGEYEITVYTAFWEPKARTTRAVTPREVTDADIADFHRRFPFGSGMDALSPRWRRLAASVLADFEFPASWPFFDRLVYDTVGRLWVRRPARPADAEHEWDVFDTELRYLGVMRLPSDLRVMKITRDRIYSIVRDELGVFYVKVHQLFPASA